VKISKNVIFILALACAAALAFNGCKGKAPTEAEKNGSTTGGTTTGTSGTSLPPPGDEHLVWITNIKDGAVGVDTKLPLEWWISPDVGDVQILNIYIFGCGPDGNANITQDILMKLPTDPELLKARKWICFEKDVDKYWFFTGDHTGLTELKPHTKYMIDFVVGGTKTNGEVKIFFTTK
jgi:hypothetical protein